MPLATGVDIIEIARVQRVVERHGERFLERIFTPAELARYRRHPAELAARFAAKEAVSKALGVGMQHLSDRGIAWQEVEILPDPHGKPEVYLSGRAADLASAQGLHRWAISLSHSREYAVAFVVATE